MKFSTFHLFHRFDGQSFKDVYDHHLRLIELAEELGFHGVRLAEHHFRDYGVVPNLFTMLAAMAARTDRIRLGTGVVVLPLHNPIHVAEEAAMVDVLSGGRLELGIGRGYQSFEFQGFGVELAEARDRFDEALEVVLGLWGAGAFRHEGKFYRTGTGVELVPRPLQSPFPPIHVAAVSPETVTMYAGRGLPILADPAAPFHKVVGAARTWRETAERTGHDVTGAELVVARSVYVAPTLERAREDQAAFEAGFDRGRIFNRESAPIDPRTGRAAQGFEYYQDRYLKGGSLSNDFRWEQLEVIGDPGRVIGQIRLLRDAGFANLLCDFGSTRPMPAAELEKVMRFFAAEVMPAFR
ncbi:alkanesulfonate monooxygenase SsuD/methylene tetrahydromethanopterin reductase-like flavin-dependent oxidoreductase (luciferase family) [Streptosporangium becharense]|uniref:Alkanesulfonate monooxygenase SsuD/methylene tetrahydromethanopterin reductase-like flavin-dependent oxidoreductase (Luciferase family) n=1 Tax=Streptosporangium becharense TaxID=1816182 RepID=A0A7W9IEX2_9ACTN|nr:LLM class flavin-dependent oxidoreductase [Streptosporangium becharense]MBB2912327.1 alkanesulfonate monooxygenase SsuD/methylene tetrahydromethanopterin reductase-like flavin-dependent oxidoreductase (luciferase family) [Streptosporangium becharense]MBB5818874.1 alkanesulfonate monooxygenase SsuD/methylene tetrahydromethanopterin reductase-like flavin-dependent oxidoreductase (luciferase family) [Streptosporangium becharense]